jgi:probable F420-dependent oxidoreductase
VGLQFSIQMPSADDARSWGERVRSAEDLGFFSISVPDHLGPALPQLAPLVALAHAAAVTSRIRLAMTVLDNDFRHPVMVAKEIATLDLLSEGRVDLGMGAGWYEDDYTRTGVATWDPAPTRVSRLWESIDLLDQLLAGGDVTFDGDFYRVDSFRSFPAPVQQRIPLMIGGGGKRMLTRAARRADIISTIVMLRGDADKRRAAFEQQLGWIADATPARPVDLPRARLGVRVFAGAVCTPGGESAEGAADRLAGFLRMDPADALTSPFLMIGEPSRIRDHFVEIHERYGVSYFTLNEDLARQIPDVIAELSA